MLEDWCDSVLDDQNTMEFDVEIQALSDKRTRKWFGYPLKNFITPLLDKRKTLKKQLKITNDPSIKGELNAQQSNVKLLINTLYGVFASQYFKLGNVVLADNITGKARTYVWLLAKCLNCNMTITDGSTYGLNEVFHLNKNDKKPSLKTFSNLQKLEAHRSIKKLPLDGVDWISKFNDYKGDSDSLHLDERVTKHIADFWGPYNIKFAYNIEHKPEHFALRTAFMGKGNYALKTYNPEKDDWSNSVFKIRGQKEFTNGIRNPYFLFLEDIINNGNSLPDNLKYKHVTLLKLKTWLQNILNDEEFDVKPGEPFITDRKMRFNNTHMSFNYQETHKAAIRKLNEKDYIGFEKYGGDGVNTMLKAMIVENEKSNMKFEKKRQKKKNS